MASQSIPVPASPRVRLYRLVGMGAVAISSALTLYLGARYPAINLLNGAICILVGKWLGIPVADIVQLALARMTPERAVQVAVDALRSLPPEQAEDATRSLLRSIPPAAVARVVGGVVLVPDPDGDPTPTVPPSA